MHLSSLPRIRPFPGSTLRIGCSGWEQPEWRTLAGLRGKRHILRRLCECVDLAEVGSTFHSPLKPEISSLYLRQTEDSPDFRFTAQLGRRFTYERDLAEEAVSAWKSGFVPFQREGKLAAVVMQFPWAFRFSAENREFLIRLRRTFHEFRLVADFRHMSWLCDEAVTTLIRHRIGLANVDQPEYFRAMPPAALLTSGVGVVRMHGRVRPEAFLSFEGSPEAQPYLYTTEQLEEWRPRIQKLAGVAPETYVMMTNGGAAHSLVNALQLIDMLMPESRARLAPAELIRKFPNDLAGYQSRKPVQAVLPELARAVA